MKKVVMVSMLCTLIGVIGLPFMSQAEAGPKKQAKNATVKKVTINLSGMTCGGCVSRVTSTLKKLKGVVTAKVTLKPQRAVVSYNSKQVSLKQMLTAVKKSGFGAGVKKLAAATGKKGSCKKDCNCAKCKAKRAKKAAKKGKKGKKACKKGCDCASCKAKRAKAQKS